MTSTMEAKERFSFNLLHPENKVFTVTILYIVYKTIERNRGISINQLKWLLNTEYMLNNTVVEGAVTSLTAKTLFNSVSRWQSPQKQETVHLRVKECVEFSKWLENSEKNHPELLIFTAPDFIPANNRGPSEKTNAGLKP